ncbi:MAG: hypothetical protein IJM25_07785, partial [Eubacterium sp.]|nr:hypothetical protein [Eubacterium sp.]
VLPEDIAGQMADSAARNKLIVDTYKEKKETYGQTIVFAVNVLHAIHLAALFKKEKSRSCEKGNTPAGPALKTMIRASSH